VQGVTETTADMYWSMPARTPVAWVGDVAGVQAMCEYIQSRLPSRHQQHQPDNGASAEHSRLQELQSSTPLLVGIDMEWRAGPQTPVAVVQVGCLFAAGGWLKAATLLVRSSLHADCAGDPMQSAPHSLASISHTFLLPLLPHRRLPCKTMCFWWMP
jgi:hypothetical protein